MLKITRAEAKALGLKKYFTGKPCPNGHVSERYVSGQTCTECNKTHRTVWRKKNRDNERATNRAWRENNPEAMKAARRAWVKNNPEICRSYVLNRIARKHAAKGSHTAADIADILRMQRKRCAEPSCRKSLANGYHVDHIKPLIRGGSNDRRNLQALCPKCNGRKGAKDPIDFAQELGRLL